MLPYFFLSLFLLTCKPASAFSLLEQGGVTWNMRSWNYMRIIVFACAKFLKGKESMASPVFSKGPLIPHPKLPTAVLEGLFGEGKEENLSEGHSSSEGLQSSSRFLLELS